MTREELNAMPKALRALADPITAMCLRDAAAMIESLRMAVADAVRRPLGVVPDSASWLTGDELADAERRRAESNDARRGFAAR